MTASAKSGMLMSYKIIVQCILYDAPGLRMNQATVSVGNLNGLKSVVQNYEGAEATALEPIITAR
jgi:hypothetical protein